MMDRNLVSQMNIVDVLLFGLLDFEFFCLFCLEFMSVWSELC